MIPNRDEDYRLYASIRSDSFSIDNVFCKVYLPERLTDGLKVLFTASDKQALPMGCPFEFSFLGERKDDLDQSILTIKSNTVYIDEHSSKSWGAGPSDVVLIGDPVDLRIEQILASSAEAEGKAEGVQGAFWLTPSKMLNPHKGIEQSYTGNVNVETFRKLDFNLTADVGISFDFHYRFAKSSNDDSISFPELVAEFKLESEALVVGSLPLLDDFLLLVSFASRQKCVCLGWDYYGNNTYTRFYRREVAIPEVNKQHGYNDTLITPPDFRAFIDVAYKKFMEFEYRDALRQAMQRVLFRTNSGSTDTFLTLYSGVETLILMSSKGIILPSEKWVSVCSDLRRFIKRHALLAGDENRIIRRSIYEKMPELNRISFSAALKTFCTTYKVDLGDLWPLTNSAEGISLSDIRNRLIHGEVFNLQQEFAMAFACTHLRLTLERMILSVLGWPVAESRASFYNAQGLCDWRNDRKKF